MKKQEAEFLIFKIIEKNPNLNVRILPEIVNNTGLAYAIRPGDWHFQSFLNTWIRYKQDS